MQKQWSEQQQKVFKEVRTGRGNLAINAGPGSGKTTTLLESLNLIPRHANSIFLSFSNGIVNELKSKVPKHVKASTLHSLGVKMISSAYKKFKIEPNKYFFAAIQNLPKDERKKEDYKKGYQIQDICTFARMTLTDWNDIDNLRAMCNYYSLESGKELLERSQELLTMQTKRTSIIDFADMIWMPAKDPTLVVQKYDYVFLDEAQDTCAAQRLLLKHILAPGGRIIFVGDKKQAIYSFTGSTIDSFDLCVKEFEANELNLNITYRCPKSVVQLAATVYDDIQAYEKNPEGVVRSGDILEVQDGDLVLCRNNKPLVALFFKLIEQGKKAYIVGKDMENGLIGLAESCKSFSKDGIIKNMDAKAANLARELSEKGVKKISLDPSYRALLEKIEIIGVILSNVNEAGQLVDKIKEIFNEDKEGVKLMTIHKSKGLEAPRVFLVQKYNDAKLLPSTYAEKDWEKTQERNLEFVAYTRAQQELVLTTLID